MKSSNDDTLICNNSLAIPLPSFKNETHSHLGCEQNCTDTVRRIRHYNFMTLITCPNCGHCFDSDRHPICTECGQSVFGLLHPRRTTQTTSHTLSHTLIKYPS